jgi:hypothetical protein
MALPGTEPATSPFAGYVSQTFGARDGFSLSGLALLLTATIGWRALTDRRAASGPAVAAAEPAETATPAGTAVPAATAALANTTAPAEPALADTA